MWADHACHALTPESPIQRRAVSARSSAVASMASINGSARSVSEAMPNVRRWYVCIDGVGVRLRCETSSNASGRSRTNRVTSGQPVDR